MKKRILLIVLAVLAVAGGGYGAWAKWGVKAEAPVAQSSGKPLAIETPKQPSEDELYNLSVKGVIDETNKYRATKGLAPLTESPLLDKSACLKADDIVAKDYWAHVSPDGIDPWHWIKQAGYTYKNAGENLAQGYGNNHVLINAWIKSPTHEVNLSGNYKEIGVCIKDNIHFQGKVYTILTVAHYGTPQ